MQKYYVRYPQSNQYGGVYVWESPEALQKWREGKLADTLAETYQVTEGPSSEGAEVMPTVPPGEVVSGQVARQ